MLQGVAVIILGFIVSLAVSVASAEIFQYTDDNGTMVFVDDLTNVPHEYAGKTRQRRSSLPDVQHARVEATSVIVSDNMIYVPVTVRYRDTSVRTLFLLDTGASVTAISASLAERLGIRDADTKPMVSRLADGSTITTRHAMLTALQAEPMMWRDVDVTIIPVQGAALPCEGWLGMNVIGKTRHQINLDSRLIQWGD